MTTSVLAGASGTSARSVPPAAEAGAPVYHAPVAGRPTVVHPFDPPVDTWAPGHRGVDLAGAPGASVLAPAAGVVTFAGQVAGRPVLTLRHPDGLRSSLEPVTATVPVGSAVVAGEAVGILVESSASHCAPGTCLHWGVRSALTYLDPLSLLAGRGPVVLLATDRPQQTRSASRI